MKGSKHPTMASLFGIFILFGATTFFSSAEARNLTVLVTDAAGRVAYRKSGSPKLHPVQAGVTRLKAGDMIVTSRNSKATLRIEGKTVSGDAGHPSVTTVEIGPKSRVLMSKLLSDLSTGAEQVQIGVAQGQVISNVRRINPANERFEVETPTAIAAVRGTRFLSDVRWKGRVAQVKFRVERGQIDLFSRTGKHLATLEEGEVADIAPTGENASVSSLSSGGGTTSSSKGSVAPTLGAGRSQGPLGGSSGESSDSIRSTGVAGDDEGDDIGGHRQ